MARAIPTGRPGTKKRAEVRLLLVGAVHHVAETLLHGKRIIVIGLTGQDGLHATVDRLVMVPVDAAFVGGASLEQLHGPHIGTVAPLLELFVRKCNINCELAPEQPAEFVPEGVLVRVLWPRKIRSAVCLGDSCIGLRERSTVALVEGLNVGAGKLDDFSQLFSGADLCNRLCVVLRRQG